MIFCRIAVTAVCSLLFAVGASEVKADETTIKAFLKEAPQKWQEYKTVLKGYELKIDSVTNYPDKKTEEHAADRFVCGRDETQALHVSQLQSPNRKEVVFGSNAQYDFQLSKEPGKKKAFSIVKSTPRKSKQESAATRSIKEQAGQICRIDTLDLAKIISSPEFWVLEATESDYRIDRSVQINFEYRPKSSAPEEASQVRTYSGTIRFDPNSFWAITAAEVKVEDASGNILSVINVENAIGFAILDAHGFSQVVTDWKDASGKPVKRVTMNYEWKEFSREDDKLFTLSAFGLPEPKQETLNAAKM